MEEIRRLGAAVFGRLTGRQRPRGREKAPALARACAAAIEQLERRTLCSVSFVASVSSPQSGVSPAAITMNFATAGGIADHWKVDFGDDPNHNLVTIAGNGTQVVQYTHTYSTNTAGYTVIATATQVTTGATSIAAFALSSAFGSNYPGSSSGNGRTLYAVPGNTGYGGGYQVAVDSAGKAYVISRDNGLMAITRFNNGVLDQTWGSSGTLTIPGFDGGSDAPFCTYIRNQYLAIAGTGHNGFAVALVNTTTQAPAWSVPATGNPAISAGQANGVLIDNNNDVIAVGTNGTNMIAVNVIGLGTNQGQLANWGDNGSGIKTITWTGGTTTGSGANAIIQLTHTASDYLVGGWKSYCYSGPGGASCTACVMAAVALYSTGTIGGTIDPYVMAGQTTAPNFGCTASGGHPINGCSGTGYPSNDAIYSLAEPPAAFADGDVWAVGSSNYPGTNQFAYADFNEGTGAMSLDGVANLGIWAGPAGTAYSAIAVTDPNPPLNGSGTFLVAAGTGTGAGAGNDFIIQRFEEQIDPGNVEYPLAINTAFGISGTFNVDFGSATANSTDGALGLALNPSNGDYVASGYSTAGLSGGASQIAMADLLGTPAVIVNPPPRTRPLSGAAAQQISTTTSSTNAADSTGSLVSESLARHRARLKLPRLGATKT